MSATTILAWLAVFVAVAFGVAAFLAYAAISLISLAWRIVASRFLKGSR